MNDQIKTQLSAFVDGELSDAESELLIRRISRDPGLQRQVAEYQALGRAVRGEYSLRLDGLLDGIRTAIDSPQLAPVEEPAEGRSWRPFAGFATAAAVALIAIVGAGQWNPDPPAVADEQYTVPSPDMREYYLRHGETSNGFNTRVVTMQLRGETLEDDAADQQSETETDQTIGQ